MKLSVRKFVLFGPWIWSEIGNIYTFYNNNRHPIEHWDDPTAPIDTTKLLDINGAHDLIKRALAINDEYYEVI